MDPHYKAVGDGVTDDTAAILAAQADMRKFRGVLRFTAPHKMTQQFQVISGDQYEGVGYLVSGLIFSGVPIGLAPRDPTDFTDFGRLENFFIQGDGAGKIAALLASCRHWTIRDLEVTGGSLWTQHSLCLFGQRWADGTSTSGGASAGVPPKTALSAGITAAATSIPVADTSQYQLGSARLAANPQSGTGFVPASYGDALANGSQPRIAKVCTLVGTLAATMNSWDTQFALASPLPVGSGSGQVPASGAVLLDTEMIWYSSYNASTGVFSGLTRQQRSGHASGKNIFVAEIFSYSAVDATHFNGTVLRGLNDTTAYAHASGASVYQNPGDSTFNRFFGGRALSGGTSYVRLGGTFGSIWLNNGTANQNDFYGTRAGGTGLATLAPWHIESGAVNSLIGIQHGNSAGDGVYVQWFSNKIQDYTAGALAVSSAAVHFSNDGTSHDNVVDFVHYDTAGNGQAVLDDSGANFVSAAYGGGLHIPIPHSPGLLTLASLSQASNAALYWHDSNGHDQALTGGYVSGTAATYNIGIYDRILIPRAGAVSRTLPDATTCAFRTYRIANKNGGSLTVNAVAGNIDGGASATLANNTSAVYVSDGTNWWSC